MALELGSAFVLLLLLADQCNVDLPLAIQRKIQLNAKKYPAVLVRYSLRTRTRIGRTALNVL